MARLSCSNIDNRLLSRLHAESHLQDKSQNEIVETALWEFFNRIDEERLKDDPPEPKEIDLNSEKNKKLMDELRLQREQKEKEIELADKEIKEVKRDFLYQYELNEFCRKLNIGTVAGDILKVHSMSIVSILCNKYNFECIKTEIVSNIPLKKIRYLRKIKD